LRSRASRDAKPVLSAVEGVVASGSLKEASFLPIFFIEGKGKTFFESVTSMGYEGIMAKRMDSPTSRGNGRIHGSR
jgi:ATP-dependent DNA ligase